MTTYTQPDQLRLLPIGAIITPVGSRPRMTNRPAYRAYPGHFLICGATTTSTPEDLLDFAPEWAQAKPQADWPDAAKYARAATILRKLINAWAVANNDWNSLDTSWPELDEIVTAAGWCLMDLPPACPRCSGSGYVYTDTAGYTTACTLCTHIPARRSA